MDSMTAPSAGQPPTPVAVEHRATTRVRAPRIARRRDPVPVVGRLGDGDTPAAGPRSMPAG
ncbi:MAG: hypothetical protein ACODAE_10945, partial [Gemmatimonadota bacterium]